MTMLGSQPSPSPPNKNGNGEKPGIKFSLPQLGAIASICTLFTFAIGFWTGYQAFTSEMNQVKYDVMSVNKNLMRLQDHVNNISSGAANDRLTLSNRLTGLEQDQRWLKEGVAELRLRSIPDRKLP